MCVGARCRAGRRRPAGAALGGPGGTRPQSSQLKHAPLAGTYAWPCQYQDQPGLLGPIAREHHRFMTTTPDKTTLPLTPGHWVVDTNHSSIGFTIRHLGVSKVRGRFTRFDADVIVGETLDTTSVRATVDIASIDTANADRDAHVLSPDLIDVARRPTMVFRSTSVQGAGMEYQVEGDLTIGDVTRPIVLAVELGGIESFPGGPRHAGFEAGNRDPPQGLRHRCHAAARRQCCRAGRCGEGRD